MKITTGPSHDCKNIFLNHHDNWQTINLKVYWNLKDHVQHCNVYIKEWDFTCFLSILCISSPFSLMDRFETSTKLKFAKFWMKHICIAWFQTFWAIFGLNIPKLPKKLKDKSIRSAIFNFFLMLTVSFTSNFIAILNS